jgi:hypothetical protein
MLVHRDNTSIPMRRLHIFMWDIARSIILINWVLEQESRVRHAFVEGIAERFVEMVTRDVENTGWHPDPIMSLPLEVDEEVEDIEVEKEVKNGANGKA